MPERNSSNEWTGPSAREMIDTHTLAERIIAHHDDPCPVFDDRCILQLRRFVEGPEHSQEILREYGMEDQPGDKLGSGANRQGSLTGYIMATWGTDQSALTPDEVDMLREWFASGGGRTDEERARQ